MNIFIVLITCFSILFTSQSALCMTTAPAGTAPAGTTDDEGLASHCCRQKAARMLSLESRIRQMAQEEFEYTADLKTLLDHADESTRKLIDEDLNNFKVWREKNPGIEGIGVRLFIYQLNGLCDHREENPLPAAASAAPTKEEEIPAEDE